MAKHSKIVYWDNGWVLTPKGLNRPPRFWEAAGLRIPNGLASTEMVAEITAADKAMLYEAYESGVFRQVWSKLVGVLRRRSEETSRDKADKASEIAKKYGL